MVEIEHGLPLFFPIHVVNELTNQCLTEFASNNPLIHLVGFGVNTRTSYQQQRPSSGILWSMAPKTLEQVKAAMAILDPNLEYYVITRTVNEQGQVTVETPVTIRGVGRC